MPTSVQISNNKVSPPKAIEIIPYVECSDLPLSMRSFLHYRIHYPCKIINKKETCMHSSFKRR